MRKVIKIIIRTLLWIVIGAVALLLLAILLLNIGPVQNYAVRKATEYISEKTGTEVSIGRVRISGFSRLTASDVYVEDLQGDTMIYAGALSARLNLGVIRSRIEVGDVKLDGGRIYLHTGEDGVMNLSQVLAAISGEKDGSSGGKIYFPDIAVTNSVLQYGSSVATDRQHVEGTVDFTDIELRDLDAECRNLVVGDTITMAIGSLSFTEKSGLQVMEFSAEQFTMVEGSLALEGLHLRTPDSDIHVPRLAVRGDSWDDFKDIANKVAFDVQITDSQLGVLTAAYFVPNLPSAAKDIVIDRLALNFKGNLNDFSGRISNLTYKETSLRADYGVKNIMGRTDNASLRLDLSSLRTTGAAVGEIMEMFMQEGGSPEGNSGAGRTAAGQNPHEPANGTAAMLANLGNIEFKANIQGKMSDFNAAGSLITSIGSAGFSGAGGVTEKQGIKMSGNISVDRFDAGRFTGNDMLGPVSLILHGEGTIKDKVSDMRVDANVRHIYLNGYDYHNLAFRGGIREKVVRGTFSADDAALKLDVRGRGDFSLPTPAYDLDVELAMADLVMMKLNKKDSVAVVGGKITASGSGISLDDFNGTVEISQLDYRTARDTLLAERIELTGRNSQSSKMFSVDSDLLTAEYYSTIEYKYLVTSLDNIVLDYLPSLKNPASRMGPHPKVDGYSDDDISTLKIDIIDADKIIRVFLPTLSVARNSTVDMEFNPSAGKFGVRAECDYVEYGNYLITKLDLLAGNRNETDSLEVRFSTDEILTSGVTIPSVTLAANIKNDNIALHADLSNLKTQVSAELDVQAALGRNSAGELTARGRVNPSSLIAGGEVWSVSSSGLFYSKERVEVDGFAVHNGRQGLDVDGVLSASRADTLRVRLADVDLGLLSGLLNGRGLVPQGRLNGHAEIISGMKNPVVEADIRAEEIGINGHPVPPMRITSQWGVGHEQMEVTLTNIGTGEQMVRGTYNPSSGDYGADVDITGLPLVVATPFIGDMVTDIGGAADIKLEVEGGKDKKKVLLNGSVTLSDLMATVGFTKAAYTIPRMTVLIEDDKIIVPSTKIADSEGGTAQLEAALDISNFSSLSYDARLSMDKIMAVNTTVRDSDSFYGRVMASGDVYLKGDKMGVDINARVSTDNGSAVHVPLGGSQNVTSADFITYRPKRRHVDSITDLTRRKIVFMRQQRQNNRGVHSKLNMNIAAALTITPGTAIMVEIDPSNVLEVRGNASLNASINPGTGDMNIFGTYGITEGRFPFNFQNIISNKLFTITPDSYIQFVGDPMDSNLHIKALHSLRASLAPLVESGVLDGDQYSRGRIPVDCIINIDGRLAQPDLSFDVVARTPDTNLHTTLNSMLATQDMKMTQFLWLVALGNFTTENMNYAGVSGTAIGIDFLTNQLNSMFSTITGDNMTINVRYRQSDELNSDEIDFGFTREFLEGRLVFEYEGNYDTGYSAYKDTPLSNNLSLTGLLNNSGNLRTKLFTRSVDRFDDNLVVQETGLGLYYREDFDRFSEVVEKIKARLSNIRRRKKKLDD